MHHLGSLHQPCVDARKSTSIALGGMSFRMWANLRRPTSRGWFNQLCALCFTSAQYRRLLIASLTVSAITAYSPAAHADARDFPFTYSWIQAARGEREIAFHTRYRQRDQSWQHQFEFEYGLSERISIAPYFVLEQGDGRKLHFDAFKLETRYQLGKHKLNSILPGLYLEFEKPNAEPGEMEGKLILSRFDSRGGNLSFNYIIQAVLRSGLAPEHSYSLGYARPFGSGRAGAELIHELTSQRILFGPTYYTTIGSGSSITAGMAFPLTSRNENRLEFRLFAQRHWL